METHSNTTTIDGPTTIEDVPAQPAEGVDTSLKDRWGNTAYHEANKMRTAIVPSEQKEPYNLICSKLETN